MYASYPSICLRRFKRANTRNRHLVTAKCIIGARLHGMAFDRSVRLMPRASTTFFHCLYCDDARDVCVHKIIVENIKYTYIMYINIRVVLNVVTVLGAVHMQDDMVSCVSIVTSFEWSTTITILHVIILIFNFSYQNKSKVDFYV